MAKTPLGKYHIREIPKMAPLLGLEETPSFCESCSPCGHLNYNVSYAA